MNGVTSFHVGFPSSSMQAVSGNIMGQSRQTYGRVAQMREAYAERVASFMRRKHPIKTAENVSIDTGVSYHTVRKLSDGLSAPSIVILDRFAKAYGLEFLHHVFAWDFLDPDKRAAEQRALEARFVALVDELKAINTRG